MPRIDAEDAERRVPVAAGEPASGLSRDALEAAIARTPFACWMNARVDEFQPGRVAISIPFKRELTMHHGFVHGAVIGFLADSACAWAAASLVGDVVTVEYKLNLVAPAVGDALHAVGEVVKTSARQAVARADIFAPRHGKQELVATALATIARFKQGCP